MPQALPMGGAGLLRVVGPAELARKDADDLRKKREAETPPEVEQPQLAGYVRNMFEVFRDHRTTSGLDARLLDARRRLRGEYDPSKLQQIRKLSGSEVYSRIVALKCRSASALLRDVYLGAQRPWAIRPTPSPTIPDDVTNSINELVSSEVATMAVAGTPPSPDQVDDRRRSLISAAKAASFRKATIEADKASSDLDDLLVEGGFYTAIDEFLLDLPIYPYAILKGPFVRKAHTVKWVDGKAQRQTVAQMHWTRVNPFMVYWTPGAARLSEADVIEHVRLNRVDLETLRGVAGYNEDAIDAVLDEYGETGYHEWLETNEHSIAETENRESPAYNRSNMFDCLEYHGMVSGAKLVDLDVDLSSLGDEEVNPRKTYSVTVWVIGRFILKVMINPDPLNRHIYYGTSFEKMPGSVAGSGLSDILQDIEDVANASLRNLVNNMGMASGPQVVVREDMLSAATNPETLYPWKRWRLQIDPTMIGGSAAGYRPIEFFQPTSNAAELLGVYEKCSVMADEISAIPRYISGSDRVGGAGRTASGLAMLMGNASKVLQSVARNIDTDLLTPMLSRLYDFIMLTDETGLLRGDENIEVMGVSVAVQKETDRMRRLEFLQLTANPIDMQIVGAPGRAEVLRSISEDLGMRGARIVPSDEELRSAMAAAQLAATEGAGTDPSQIPAPGSGGAGRVNEATDNLTRTSGT